MRNDTFYEGFEGEGEVCFTNGDDELVIWVGYFYTIYDSIFSKAEKGGMLDAYTKCEDGYDWAPGQMEEMELTIRQLSCFDGENTELPTRKTQLKSAKNAIISFLRENIDKGIHVAFD